MADTDWIHARDAVLADVEPRTAKVLQAMRDALVEDTGDARGQARAIAAALMGTAWRWTRYPKTADHDPRKMAEELVNAVYRGYYNNQHQAFEAELPASDKAYVMLMCASPDRTRPECIAIDGEVFPADDQIWQTIKVPCKLHTCGCRKLPMGADDVARHGLSVSRTR